MFSTQEEPQTAMLVSLKRTGENFILIWPLVIGVAWAAEKYYLPLIQIVATASLLLVFAFVCVPNIGRIGALSKLNFGLSNSIKNQLYFAYLGAITVLVAIASIWANLGIAWCATLIAFVIAFVNSLSANNQLADEQENVKAAELLIDRANVAAHELAAVVNESDTKSSVEITKKTSAKLRRNCIVLNIPDEDDACSEEAQVPKASKLSEDQQLEAMYARVRQVFPLELLNSMAHQQRTLTDNAINRVLNKDGVEALTLDRLEGIKELVTQHLWSDALTTASKSLPASAMATSETSDSMTLADDPALGAIREHQRRLAMSSILKENDEILDNFGNPTAPYLAYENYKKLKFKCRSCTWSGLGVDLEMGEVFESLFEIECPKCMTYIGAVGFPIAPLPS